MSDPAYEIVQTNYGEVVHRSDGAWIPMDEANRDYQEYLAWVNDGNEAPTVTPEPSPS